MTRRAMTMFTGGGGADVGLIAAGWQVVAGLEYDPDIAAVANANLGGHVRVGDVLDANPDDFPDCDLLHASPPCPSFSVAKADGKETDHDIAMARKVAEFVTVKRPRLFTLENVRGYKDSQSFTIICEALRAAGYQWRVAMLNAADFGVPQTRVRLFILAGRDHLPPEPRPTHQKGVERQPTLFEVRLPRWVGWLESIQDLVPTLPESKFADWQLKRLPAELSTMLVGAGGFDGTVIQSKPNAPCFTITANQNQKDQLRAFIVGGANTSSEQAAPGVGVSEQDEPTRTVNASNSNNWRAFIVPGGNASSFSVRDADEPTRCVGDVDRVGNIPRAFIVDDQNGSKNADGTRELSIRDSPEPIFTIPASEAHRGSYRAFIVDQQNGSRDSTVRVESEPVFTTTNYSVKHPAPRACLPAGRVVKMTPRCLARFQSFPDSYALPEKDALACRIIGNAVPPLLYQRIVEALDSGVNIA